MTTCKIISEFILSNTIFFLTDMTQQELLTIWAEEAKEALGAKKSGIILDLWKVVAERKVSTSMKIHMCLYGYLT